MISFSEVLVVFVVALVALGPKQWPRLIYHMGQLALKLSKRREQLTVFWTQFLAEQRLIDNQRQATRAAKNYQQQEQKHE
ncbi:MAG: preprotein translocase subunit TatB [Gammaproteobacteria bacterium]|nr:preprotein translocase subunit TatB [Gammaproteobacteria bacterium]